MYHTQQQESCITLQVASFLCVGAPVQAQKICPPCQAAAAAWRACQGRCWIPSAVELALDTLLNTGEAEAAESMQEPFTSNEARTLPVGIAVMLLLNMLYMLRRALKEFEEIPNPSMSFNCKQTGSQHSKQYSNMCHLS